MFHISDILRLFIITFKYGLILTSIFLLIWFYFYHHNRYSCCYKNYLSSNILSSIALIILPLSFVFGLFIDFFYFFWHPHILLTRAGFLARNSWCVSFKITHNPIINTTHSFYELRNKVNQSINQSIFIYIYIYIFIYAKSMQKV